MLASCVVFIYVTVVSGNLVIAEVSIFSMSLVTAVESGILSGNGMVVADTFCANTWLKPVSVRHDAAETNVVIVYS